MTDNTNTERSIEDRLSDYGSVLQGHLDGTADTDDQPAGMFLVGAPQAAAKRSVARPTAAIVSIAAAILLLVGLVVPGLADDPGESITIADTELANQPQDLDEPGADASDPTADKTTDQTADGADAAAATDKGQEASGDDADWSQFAVRASDEDKADGVDVAADGEQSTTESSDEDEPGNAQYDAAAAGTGDAGDKADEDKADDDKADDGKADDDKPEDDKADSAACASDEVKKDGACVKVAESPGDGSGDCPAGAVVFSGECYEVVPPSCGDLEVDPGGEGCLKLVGSASAQSGCPNNYELQGDTCVKLLAATVSCSQGVPANGECLIKQEAPSGSAGCAEGLVKLGGGCYELSAPTASSCGDLATLPNGMCRFPVTGDSASSCPAGFEVWGDICYRYEDAPTYTCAVGESDGSGWCKSTEPGTPGPDVCDDGVLQDATGCYILVDFQEDGTCGQYVEFQGQCRKDKPSYPTWTCADGKTVYENACFVYTEAVVTCAAGEPVDGGKCKSIVAPTATTGCPDYALEDGQGCYKEKPAVVNCGDLPVAPDGQNCKTWVSDAGSAGAQCPSGFDLVGAYCKKYVEGGAPSCSGAELVNVGGEAKCRYTTPAGPNATGCGANEVEKAGSCYKIVAPTCGDLAVDIYGNGCKKLIKDS